MFEINLLFQLSGGGGAGAELGSLIEEISSRAGAGNVNVASTSSSTGSVNSANGALASVRAVRVVVSRRPPPALLRSAHSAATALLNALLQIPIG